MKTCCFIGHRNAPKTEKLYLKIKNVVTYLIKEKKVSNFLFGSASDFDDLCYDVVTEIKKEHPEIKRVYVRSHFPYINQDYTNYLLESFDETYVANRVENAGRASYVERNQEMIVSSEFCVFYYDEKYNPPKRIRAKGKLPPYQPKSGTQIAYEYAKRNKKQIYNLFIEK